MQATNAAAGMLAPLDRGGHARTDDAASACARCASTPRSSTELEAECGFDTELRLDGILKVAFEPEQLDELRRRYAWQRELGLPLDWLERRRCREFEPRISDARPRRRVLAGRRQRQQSAARRSALERAADRARRRHSPANAGHRLRDARRTRHRRAQRRRVVRVRHRRAGGGRALRADRAHGCGSAPARAARARPDDRAGRHVDADPAHRLGAGRLPRAARQRPRLRRRHGGGRRIPAPDDEGGRPRHAVDGDRRSCRNSRRPKCISSGRACDPARPTACRSIGPLPAWPNVVAATGHYRNGILLGPLTRQARRSRASSTATGARRRRSSIPARFSIAYAAIATAEADPLHTE